MPFVQSIDTCLEERIGPEGLSARAYADALARVEGGLDRLRQAHADGSLPLLRLPARTDDLAQVGPAVARLLEGAGDVVFLGTGGSGLGGQTIAQLAGHGVPGLTSFRPGPRLHFLDNLDPGTLDAVLDALPLASARFVVTSKSGGTGETIMQVVAVLDRLLRAGLGDLGRRLLGITEPSLPGRPNGLRAILSGHGVPILDHDPGIGGRFSGLTPVGLVPAAACGLDLAALRRGAAGVLQPILAGSRARDIPAATAAAVAIGLSEEKGKSQTVLMAYADRLERFTAWFVQLWGESLGKQGRGTTPIRALGPVDQHSQLQLFLAGPRDKLFTVVTMDARGRGARMNEALAAAAGQPDFAGRTVGDLVTAQGRATADTFANNGLPVRTIRLSRLDESVLGALMMHFFVETILAGHLLGVDPFDQPAVEEGKVLAKRYLAQG